MQNKKPNHFTHRISKDLIHWMPMTGFNGEVVIVDTPGKIKEAVRYLNRQQLLGVDTETRPSFKRGEHFPTALVQIATEERCFLFRLSVIGMPPELADVFANPKIRKVGLAFKDDINGLRRLRNFTPRNCVDIQKIVGKYGILDLGLQKIFAICFGSWTAKDICHLFRKENFQITTTYQLGERCFDSRAGTLCIHRCLGDTAYL